MTVAILLCVSACAGVGAALRFVVDTLVSRLWSGQGVGIAVVNVVGCFTLGLLTRSADFAASPFEVFLVAGVLGGFTTFSTAMVTLAELVTARRYWQALVLGGGVAASALLGFALAHTI